MQSLTYRDVLLSFHYCLFLICEVISTLCRCYITSQQFKSKQLLWLCLSYNIVSKLSWRWNVRINVDKKNWCWVLYNYKMFVLQIFNHVLALSLKLVHIGLTTYIIESQNLWAIVDKKIGSPMAQRTGWGRPFLLYERSLLIKV